MGVYIKGMEMPKSCAECDCWSMCWNGIPAYNMCKSVCPLVPVPAHGALMDRDDFFATCLELVDGYKTITDDFVVIPAEEGET